jgi:uncharacterized small protein (DUF1192 family)
MHGRTKSVCIRVSEEELRTLQQASERTGRRTVSGLAREAMHRIVDAKRSAPLASQDLQFWLSELNRRLASLQGEVARLQAVLGHPVEVLANDDTQ